ncbi:hypothetical protein [Nocardioides caricicola]|uniref:Uncharacterized protein n=1 Tax=Nocardioides caricicola TaxID=634770 RepID=A0ABW0N2B9_9ACTN
MRARLVAALTAAVAVVPAFLVVGASPAQASGNSGTVKISEVGGAADESNDPHVGCSFDVQWYGFDRSSSAVTFASWAPTQAADLTVSGPAAVPLGNPASGSELNTIQTYTLAFTGADPAAQGYHVKLTVETTRPDGRKGVTKYKTFWVDCEREDASTEPTDPDNPGNPGNPGEPTTPGTPFDWDWTYPTPTCDALSLTYPASIPAGQANDANVRFATASGQFTLNFHNNAGTWSGAHVFDFKSHPQWPAGLTDYHVVWTQVGGTNYHWQGDVACAPVPTTDPEEPFSWDWEYADPTCTALTVGYPANIPAGQANDANIRFESNVGQFTLNFHNNDGTWSGTHVFDYRSHPQWPAGVTEFHVVWTQVGGTNYHWQGDVACVIEDGTAKAVTEVAGFKAGKVTVSKGATVASDAIVVDGAGFQDLYLQMSTTGQSSWKSVSTVTTTASGTGRVTFPQLTRKGTYRFRVVVAESGISTGDTTDVLTVKVR